MNYGAIIIKMAKQVLWLNDRNSHRPLEENSEAGVSTIAVDVKDNSSKKWFKFARNKELMNF